MDTQQIITIYIARLVNMIDCNKHTNENKRYVFTDKNGLPNAEVRKMGENLYEHGGTTLMHTVMNNLLNIVTKKINNGEKWLVFDLRQLEFCWDGIGMWQA